MLILKITIQELIIFTLVEGLNIYLYIYIYIYIYTHTHICLYIYAYLLGYFYSDSIVLHIDFSIDYTTVYLCQNSLNTIAKQLHFTICKLINIFE